MKNSVFLALVCVATILVPGNCWDAFSGWSECIAPGGCGYGFEIRSRTCANLSCAMDDPTGYAEIRSCYTVACAGHFSVLQPWKEPSSCDAGCGPGMTTRVRTCAPDVFPGSPNCTGPFVESQVCNEGACPLYRGGDCYDFLRPENYHGNISVAGNGKPCVAWDHPDSMEQPSNPDNAPFKLGDGPFCRNPNDEVRPWCYFEKRDGSIKGRRCEVDFCNPFSYWSALSCWSPWSATCGQASRTRTRICIGGKVGDPGCQGEAVETETMSLGACPTVCYDYSI